MQTHRLICHPDTPASAGNAIVVELGRSIDFLHVSFELEGNWDMVRWPALAEPTFKDGLWQQTCFEAFCRTDGREAYREVNISPSSEWAVYDFSGYRRGMSRAPRRPVRHFRAKMNRVEAVIDIGRGDWTLGLSAVIEEIDGSKSYWAIRHPAGKPDFHNRDCFALELPSPKQP